MISMCFPSKNIIIFLDKINEDLGLEQSCKCGTVGVCNNALVDLKEECQVPGSFLIFFIALFIGHAI